MEAKETKYFLQARLGHSDLSFTNMVLALGDFQFCVCDIRKEQNFRDQMHNNIPAVVKVMSWLHCTYNRLLLVLFIMTLLSRSFMLLALSTLFFQLSINSESPKSYLLTHILLPRARASFYYLLSITSLASHMG